MERRDSCTKGTGITAKELTVISISKWKGGTKKHVEI
jgi:hypothetical protein